MSDDLRSSRMPSVEGRGFARSAWQAYERKMRDVLDPMLDPMAKRYGASVVNELLGFWLLWHLHGGFEGIESLGMGRTTIFRKIKRFRQLFGVHPDEYVMPGVTIDLDIYKAGAAEAEALRQERRAQTKS
ncbi:MAG: hypothetical protein AB7Q42_09710 [Acidimicrobiia bacterium]